jgi:hypothetical protein
MLQNRKDMVQRVFRQFAWQAAKLSRIEGSGWCITSVSEDSTSVSLLTELTLMYPTYGSN